MKALIQWVFLYCSILDAKNYLNEVSKTISNFGKNLRSSYSKLTFIS